MANQGHWIMNIIEHMVIQWDAAKQRVIAAERHFCMSAAVVHLTGNVLFQCTLHRFPIQFFIRAVGICSSCIDRKSQGSVRIVVPLVQSMMCLSDHVC